MESKNYYQVLGVSRDAKLDEIKKAFRKLARKFHPDVSKESDANERMKEINEAYAVLCDQDKRAAYDELFFRPEGARDRGQSPPWPGGDGGLGPDASDFFHNIFGQAGQARQSQEFRMRGQDQHGRIEIALADAYLGAQRELSLRTPELDAQGMLHTRQQVLSVRIPKGIRAGQQIRLQGQGGPGFGGAPSGDLFLEVVFRPEAGYRVDGADVYQQVPLAPWEAALGAAIDLPTPGGTFQVTVPPDSQAGRRLRLKGKGIPGAAPGDLFLVLEVVLPRATSEAQRAAYLAMAREMPFNPRLAKEIPA